MKATLSTDEGFRDFCGFGSLLLDERLEAMSGEIEGAKERADIEHVHQLRVYSRRIRAALPLFQECFDEEGYARYMKGIKKVTKSLGAARDLDVQIEFLERYREQAGSPTEMRGIDHLIESKRRERDAVQPHVVKSLTRLQNTGILEEMRGWCRENRRKEGEATPHTLFRGLVQISQGIDAVMEFEPFVDVESEKEKHHAMRIAAKHLRYTMEMFQIVFGERMKESVKWMKALQDVLGDMHDSDVWLEHLDLVIDDVKDAETRRGLELFHESISRIRGSLYSDLVDLWGRMREERFFEDLLEMTTMAVLSLDSPPERVGLIADAHGNLPALEAVMRDAEERGISILINAGDTVGLNPHSEETLGRIRESKSLSVVGNFDQKMLESLSEDPSSDPPREILSDSSTSFLRSLPSKLRFVLNGHSYLLVHGSPDKVDEHVYANTPNERLSELASMARADVVIMGHSHKAMSRNSGGTLFVNPGSLGMPYDGDSRASYSVLDTRTLEVRNYRVPYDVITLAMDIRQAGMPEEVAQALLNGRSMRSIMEDEARFIRESAGVDIENIKASSHKYGEPSEHSLKVSELGLEIFDALRPIHHMEDEWRELLEAGALLHDIGWANGAKGHNKSSLRYILNDQGMMLTSRQRYIVGSLARYHRKRLPRDDDFHLAALDDEDRERTLMLASILRVADGLDASHWAMVKKMEVEDRPQEILITCTTEVEPIMETESFERKKDLFELVFGKPLRLKWKLENLS